MPEGDTTPSAPSTWKAQARSDQTKKAAAREGIEAFSIRMIF
jgi:hypothetical protein